MIPSDSPIVVKNPPQPGVPTNQPREIGVRYGKPRPKGTPKPAGEVNTPWDPKASWVHASADDQRQLNPHEVDTEQRDPDDQRASRRASSVPPSAENHSKDHYTQAPLQEMTQFEAPVVVKNPRQPGVPTNQPREIGVRYGKPRPKGMPKPADEINTPWDPKASWGLVAADEHQAVNPSRHRTPRTPRAVTPPRGHRTPPVAGPQLEPRLSSSADGGAPCGEGGSVSVPAGGSVSVPAGGQRVGAAANLRPVGVQQRLRQDANANTPIVGVNPPG